MNWRPGFGLFLLKMKVHEEDAKMDVWKKKRKIHIKYTCGRVGVASIKEKMVENWDSLYMLKKRPLDATVKGKSNNMESEKR